MDILYLYNLLLLMLFPFFRKHLVYIIAATFPLFLLFLPDTGYDFRFYEEAYNTVYFDANAPLFFRSRSYLTAEPGWFAYMGIIKPFIPDFRYFLVFNFLLCLFLIKRSLTIMGVRPDLMNLMIALMVPVQFITIMFWSPRSALPLALCFYSFALLQKNRLLLPLLLLLIAGNIHSQYLVVIAAMLSYQILDNYVFAKYSKKISIAVSLGLLFVAFISVQTIVAYLSFLPSAAILNSKLSYLSADNTGFRITGILSIFIYPMFLYVNRKNTELKGYFDLLLFFTVFSFLMNVAFIENAHIAGRLSRVTDYFLFPFVLGYAALLVNRGIGAFFLIPLFVVFPFMFPGLYDFREIMTSLFGAT